MTHSLPLRFTIFQRAQRFFPRPRGPTGRRSRPGTRWATRRKVPGRLPTRWFRSWWWRRCFRTAWLPRRRRWRGRAGGGWGQGAGGAGRVKVVARDALGNAAEGSWSAPYEVVPKLVVASLLPDRMAPQAAEMATVRWEAVVTGGVGGRAHALVP